MAFSEDLNDWVACPKIQRPPKSKSILRKSTKSVGSGSTVKFSKDTWHHQKIQEIKGPSQGVIQKCEPQERNPRAPTFEDRTHQETLQQERCARREAWDSAKSVYKLKTKDKATFCSPTEAWVMPAHSSKKPEEREFVVDSGASVHMLSKKDLSSAELEILQKSRNPTTVITANGEVQTREEAQVYVHDRELFVTVQILDDTPAVLS